MSHERIPADGCPWSSSGRRRPRSALRPGLSLVPPASSRDATRPDPNHLGTPAAGLLRAAPFLALAVSILPLIAGCTGPRPRPGRDGAPLAVVDGAVQPAARPPFDIKPETAPPPSGILPPSEAQHQLERATRAFFQHNPSQRLYIQLDKPIYQPGETVWVRSLAVTPATLAGPPGESGLLVRLVSPKGSVVAEKRVKAIAGNGFCEFDLPDSIQGGEYTLKVRTMGGVEEKRTFLVSAYEPPRFKKTLDFLKKAYGAGDTVAASIEVKRPTGEPFAGRDLVALVTLDDVELPRVRVRTDAKGTAVVRVKLPQAIDRGDGILTVLVDDAGVTESITKRVPIIVNKLQVQIFPEGGDLVEGLPSRVYFAAKNPLGKPADIEARIVDDRGTPVTTFASVRDGLGRFALTPVRGRSYELEVTKPAGVTTKFPLPRALPEGCVLRTYDDLLGREPAIRAAVHCTEPRTVVVAATLREQWLGAQTAKVDRGRPAVVHLPLARPEATGVARVTVFSEDLEPLAERLVFRNWNRGLRVTLKPAKPTTTPRGEVVLDVETRDQAGQPVAAELAMAVVDDTVLSFADDKTAHLVAQLLLAAEVPGAIEEPNWYFKEDKREAPLGLELLLGTRGWRRFEWRRVLAPPPAATGGFGALGAAEGFGAGGAIGRPRLEGRPRGGGFAVPPRGRAAAPPAAAPAMPQAAAARPPAAPLQAVPDRLPARAKRVPADRAALAGGPPPAKAAAQPAADREDAKPKKAEMLAEAPRREAKAAADPARPLLAAERRRPMPVPRPGFAAGKRADIPRGPMAVVPPRGRAEPLEERPAEASPEPGDKDWEQAGVSPRPATGWAKVRVFPVPSYTPGYDGPRTDFRETIYWNPSVQTDANGKARVSFFASDAVTSFRVTAEGISQAGLPGRAETVIASKLPFFMEAKLPLEVSAGDRLDVPLTLRNEQREELPVDVRATFGPGLTLLDGPPSGAVALGASAGVTRFYQLEAGSGGSGRVEVSFGAQTRGLKDEFQRTLAVVPAGFPRTHSQSGTLSGRVARTFDLGNAIPGSVSAKVILYPTPLASMLTGLDSILREPYGCFEQASSANYPNIMVVRYMQERNVANPALLDRTSRLLESGYRKIASFESRSRGYEWFGGDPGHEALTAYGLMEFVDMKAVYGGVDDAMVRRTVDWLNGRRDGRGGFLRNPKALDSFGRANQEITNAYIVFAIAEAGITTMSQELRAVVQHARGSNDPYVVALAARAAARTGHPDAALLARRLVGFQQQDGRFVGAIHSITRSGGHSLAVETTALAVLALLSSKSHPAELRRAVAWLLGARTGHGGFGSTQATVLALKALTEYDLASRQARVPGSVTVLVNGQVAKTVPIEPGQEEPVVIEGLGGLFRPGQNSVELRQIQGAEMPFTVVVDSFTREPASSPEVPLRIQTSLAKSAVKMGETVRVSARLESTSQAGLPMTLLRIGIPGGLAYQNWQLKELVEKKAVDFFETRPREIILYFRSLPPGATKEVAVDLVANVPGVYTAPPSSAYLYYTAEHKTWAPPLKVQVTRP